jgi:hypothetical protein
MLYKAFILHSPSPVIRRVCFLDDSMSDANLWFCGIRPDGHYFEVGKAMRELAVASKNILFLANYYLSNSDSALRKSFEFPHSTYYVESDNPSEMAELILSALKELVDNANSNI